MKNIQLLNGWRYTLPVRTARSNGCFWTGRSNGPFRRPVRTGSVYRAFSLILVVNGFGELKPKRTEAASSGSVSLPAARLSCLLLKSICFCRRHCHCIGNLYLDSRWSRSINTHRHIIHKDSFVVLWQLAESQVCWAIVLWSKCQRSRMSCHTHSLIEYNSVSIA